MKDRYAYLAVLTFADDGISIEFPDLPGCLSCADTEEDALQCAQEALGLHLFGMEQDGDTIPAPSSIQSLTLDPDQAAVLVSVYMPLVRNQVKTVSVKKTLTIPAWINALAEEQHINFSQVLQDALKERIGVK